MDHKLDASERALLDDYRQDVGPSDDAIERIRILVEGEVAARPLRRRRWGAMVALTMAAASLLWWLRPARHPEVRVADHIESADGADAGDAKILPPSNGERAVGMAEDARVSSSSGPQREPHGDRHRRTSDWRERIRSRARQKPAASQQPLSRAVPAPLGSISIAAPPAASSVGRLAASAKEAARPRPSSTQVPSPGAVGTPAGASLTQPKEKSSSSGDVLPSSSPEPSDASDTGVSQDDNKTVKPDNADAGYDQPPTSDSPPEGSTPEGYCDHERDGCLDGGGDASCFDAWASCLIELACESFHDQQCLTEFTEADCAVELQRCYLIPEDYFLEVCRFRLNQCTEDNPETADLCEAELQPCFDAAAEIFDAIP